MSGAKPAGVDRRIIEQAAQWLVKLHDGVMTDADRHALQHWREQDREHERAWQAADALARTMGAVPPAVGMAALEGARRLQRRALLKTLGVLLTAAPSGWLAWRGWNEFGGADWLSARNADFRTGTGERRELMLDDGSRVVLNTASALDVVYTAQQRTLILRAGEIYIQTARDPQSRNFVVQTRHGAIRALGTRFVVRQEDSRAHSTVAVLQHAVEVRPLLGAGLPVRIDAGRQARFDERGVGNLKSVRAGAGSWIDGVLIADRQRLGDFLAELSRYRAGILRCDPDVADLLVSGVFRTDDTTQALATLQETLPIAVHMHTRYWVTVAAAEKSA